MHEKKEIARGRVAYVRQRTGFSSRMSACR